MLYWSRLLWRDAAVLPRRDSEKRENFRNDQSHCQKYHSTLINKEIKFSWVMSIIDLCLQCSLLHGDLSVRISVQEITFAAKCRKKCSFNHLFNFSNQNMFIFIYLLNTKKNQKQILDDLTDSQKRATVVAVACIVRLGAQLLIEFFTQNESMLSYQYCIAAEKKNCFNVLTEAKWVVASLRIAWFPERSKLLSLSSPQATLFTFVLPLSGRYMVLKGLLS